MKQLQGLVEKAQKEERLATSKQGRIMLAQGIPEEWWSFMIALQLTGKAQQAYTTMNATEAVGVIAGDVAVGDEELVERAEANLKCSGRTAG